MRGISRFPRTTAICFLGALATACGGATSATIGPPPEQLGDSGSSCRTDADCPAGYVCRSVLVGEVQEQECVLAEAGVPDAGTDAPAETSDAPSDVFVPPATCGPSLESPISTSPQLWLKADCLGLADGASVGAWADARGAGIVATQTTAGLEPSYAASGIHGKPVVRFTQAAQAFLSLPAGLVDATYTIVAAGAPTSSARLTFLGATDPYLSD
jgi:hypothetical protein